MFVVIGLIIAFILVVLLSNRATRNCRWREYRVSGNTHRRRWQCVACGAEVFTSDAAAPKVCYDPARRKP
jgi:hypothetical protein